MDDWQRRVLLEGIIYKMFRKIKLNDRENEMVQNIVETRDYGKVLD